MSSFVFAGGNSFAAMFDRTLKEENKLRATILAFAVIPVSGLATDIYLPSMPGMAVDMHQPESNIQLTLTIFLVSYGLTQFFAGAVVDAFGRYKISLISLLLFVFSFWITAQTKNIYIIYTMRVVHGILSGFAIVSKRAFFVDAYEGEKRKHYLSIMTIIWSLGPIVAPFIGGYLQKNFGWQSNFIALAIYCAALFLLELFFSGETIHQKHPFKITFLVGEFGRMFRTADFFYGMLMCGLSYGLTFFYNLCGPFIIEHRMGYSAVVTGYASLLMGMAWMAGGFLGKALIKRPFLPKLRNANFFQLLCIATMFATSYLLSNLYTLIVFAFFVHFMAGFIFNNYFAYCIGRFPKSAGIAGGLTGGVSFIITSAVSYSAAAVIKPTSQAYVAIGYFIIAAAGFVVLMVVKARKAHI